MLGLGGMTPLEAIRSATANPAHYLGLDGDLGSIEPGKLADLVVVEGNPLQDLKVLYGTGAIRVTPDNKVVRVGGVRYTIKDWILYDAKKLLAQIKGTN